MNQRYIWNDPGWGLNDNAPDRATQFGDGLFETIRTAADGDIPLLEFHQQRLFAGLQKLRFNESAQQKALVALAALSELSEPSSCLKIMVSRGITDRGYAAAEDLEPLISVQVFSASPLVVSALNVGINTLRLARQPALAGVKHLNRLEQVLARQQFAPHWDESLLLDTDERVVEGVMSNAFLYIRGRWVTPELDCAGVRGVTRAWLLRNYPNISIEVITQSDLLSVEAMAFTNTLAGVRWVSDFDGRTLQQHSDCTVWQQDYMRMFA